MEFTMEIDMITTETIDLLEENGFSGLSFRRFQGETDYPKMLASIQGSKEADGIERSDTLEDIVHNYSHLVNCDPYQDMLFAVVDGQVVGYTRVWWNQNLDGDWFGFHLAFLLPAWRGKGIGSIFLKHNEKRLREIAGGLTKDGMQSPEVSRYFEVFCSDTEASKESLLKKNGYAAIRHFFEMVRPSLEDIPEAPMPVGLEVRSVQPEHLPAIWTAMQEAFRDHWNYVPPAEEDYLNWLENPIHDRSLWKVAWDSDQVAGMVLSFINHDENREYNRERGYTEDISVRRPWRKRGLARSLIVQSLQAVKERGMTEAALGVDANNLTGALRLYESVGFQVTRRSSAYRKPLLELDE
jgi:mycothiol synthase